jgi:aryl-alcohol dehydrogenase-like predicted oxidoreductase
MEYRSLGRSGIAVSAIGLGVMNFGDQLDEASAFRLLDMAFDHGVTLFDTAENYPAPVRAETQGRSETILGAWVKARRLRERVVIATKIAGPGNAAGDMRHIRGDARRLDRANIDAALAASLRRLGTDRIDLYQLHWPERAVSTHGRSRYSRLPRDPAEVPLEETLAALGPHVAAGRIGAVGVCNESPWGVMHALATPDVPRIAAIQNGYSLLDRRFELGLAEIAEREGLGLLAYSPLAAGLLSGKYDADPAPIAGSRSAMNPGFSERFTPAKREAVAAYSALARAHGLTPAAMALAFVRQQPFTTAVLAAASSPAQLEANLAAAELVLPPELVKAINRIHDSRPNP